MGRPGWCPAGWQRAVHGIGQGGAAAGSGSAGGPGAVGPTSNTPSYAGAVVVGRESVGPSGGGGGARRGSAATGPGVPPDRGSMTTPSGRGAGRGATVAQTPVQLAGAAAQRDARDALLQWNVALTLMGTMGRRQRERCRMWQPSPPAPVQATGIAPPVTEVPVTTVAPSLASASASTETPVSVEVAATVGTPASAEAGPSGVGRGGEAGWR